MRNSKTYNLLFIAFLSLSLSVCEQVADCNLEKTYAQLKVKLYDKDLLTEEKIKYDSIKAIGSDSLFFTSNDSLSIYSLDLNSSLNITSFLFYSELNTDTLTVMYDKIVKVPFIACDPIIDISNITINHSTFDSTVLIFDIININIIENIEVYQ